MLEICDKAKCTGCGACANACPKNCISIQPNNEIGHIYPVIENDVCIDCKLCQKIFPQNREVDFY